MTVELVSACFGRKTFLCLEVSFLADEFDTFLCLGFSCFLLEGQMFLSPGFSSPLEEGSTCHLG